MSFPTIRLSALALLLASALTLASPLRTRQDTGYFPGYDMGTLMMNEATRSATLYEPSTTSGVGNSRGKSTAKAPVARNAKTLLYTPSRARTQKNVAAFAGKMKVNDPQGAKAMEGLFATTDVMAQLEVEMKKLGLTRTNIADAYALWWTTAWLATQGSNDTPSEAQLKGVKSQATAAMLKAPQLAGLDDAQKQEFAEAFLIQAMLIDASVDAAKEDPALMEPLKEAVARGAKATGLDLATMTLTDEGFRPVAAR